MEKTFWICIILWFLLRVLLLGCQFVGNSDPLVQSQLLKYFTDEDIASGKSYALSGFWFKAVYGFLYLAVIILLLRLGFFSWLWTKAKSFVGIGLLKGDLLYIVVFFLILKLLSFPSSFYFGYLKENSTGFSNFSLMNWFLLYLKSASINMLFQTIFVMAILTAFQYMPHRWPLVLPFVMLSVVAIAIILMPIIVTPLFYNQKPLEKGEFKDRLLAIAKKADLPVSEIYVIDESRYSRHTNAYFTGFGSFRRIVLYDNLIKSHTPDEAALIFAHEAGHWKHNHVLLGISLGFLGAFLGCLALKWAWGYMMCLKWSGLSEFPDAGAIPFLFLVVFVFQLFFSPIECQISQFMETQADMASIELTALKETFIKAQVRLAKDNKADLMPHPFRVFWLYSHPTALQRIKLALDKKF